MFAFICRFHNLPALVAFSSSFVQMTAGRDSRLATTAKMVASICWLELKMNVHAIHLQYPKIQSDSLENRLNSRNHTTGLFIANNHLHPLVVVWRVEVWHFLFQLPYEGFDAFLCLSERLHSALFLQIRRFFILKQDQHHRMLSTSITALAVIL